MAIFGDDGQAIVNSLSDEAIYGEQQEAAEERQEEGQPQQQPDNIENKEEASPGENQTSENGGGDDAPLQEGQAVISAEEHQRLQKNYDELRSWTSRVDTKNKRLEEENKLLKQQLQSSTGADTAKNNLRNLIADPEQTIDRLVAQKMEPFLTEQQEAKRKEAFSSAVQDCLHDWPQLKNADSGKEIVAKMVELAQRRGQDAMAWRDNPGDYMVLACRELYGIPRIADPAAIEAAKKAGREEALRELEEKRHKNGLSLTPNANTGLDEKADISPEEQIRQEIRRYSSHGIFG